MITLSENLKALAEKKISFKKKSGILVQDSIKQQRINKLFNLKYHIKRYYIIIPHFKNNSLKKC